LAQSQRFAAQLRHRFGADISITISPLIAPIYLAPRFPPGPWAALIFTSETGVAAYLDHPNRPQILPKTAFCVGNRTAKMAEVAGLVPISANGDAAALISLIQHDARAPLLHLCGKQTCGDVAVKLTDAGHPTTALPLYDQREQPLTDAAIALLRGDGAVFVPLFSPRTAAIFCKQLGAAAPTAPITVVALSDAVAAALSGAAPHRTANSPTADAMIAALAQCQDAAQTP
jgi:uroporphyrinogen-III synthase